MKVQPTQSNLTNSQSSSNDSSAGFRPHSPSHQRSSITGDGQSQPQKLRLIAANRLGDMLQSNEAARQPMLKTLPEHLSGPMSRQLELTNLSHLRNAIENIPPA